MVLNPTLAAKAESNVGGKSFVCFVSFSPATLSRSLLRDSTSEGDCFIFGGSHIVFLFQCSFHDYDFNYDLDHDLDFGCDYDCDFDLIGSIEWEGVWFGFGGSFSSEEPCSGREC